MTYDEKSSEIVLSSGRRFYAFGDALSISSGEYDLVHYGSDGGEIASNWTPAERREVADEMIRRWTEWANATPEMIRESEGWPPIGRL